MPNNPGCCVSLVIPSGDHTINYNVMNEYIMFFSVSRHLLSRTLFYVNTFSKLSQTECIKLLVAA